MLALSKRTRAPKSAPAAQTARAPKKKHTNNARHTVTHNVARVADATSADAQTDKRKFAKGFTTGFGFRDTPWSTTTRDTPGKATHTECRARRGRDTRLKTTRDTPGKPHTPPRRRPGVARVADATPGRRRLDKLLGNLKNCAGLMSRASRTRHTVDDDSTKSLET